MSASDSTASPQHHVLLEQMNRLTEQLMANPTEGALPTIHLWDTNHANAELRSLARQLVIDQASRGRSLGFVLESADNGTLQQIIDHYEVTGELSEQADFLRTLLEAEIAIFSPDPRAMPSEAMGSYSSLHEVIREFGAECAEEGIQAHVSALAREEAIEFFQDMNDIISAAGTDGESFDGLDTVDAEIAERIQTWQERAVQADSSSRLPPEAIFTIYGAAHFMRPHGDIDAHLPGVNVALAENTDALFTVMDMIDDSHFPDYAYFTETQEFLSVNELTERHQAWQQRGSETRVESENLSCDERTQAFFERQGLSSDALKSLATLEEIRREALQGNSDQAIDVPPDVPLEPGHTPIMEPPGSGINARG